MNSPIIRAATPDDLPDLLRFEQGVIDAERPHDPTLKSDAVKYYNFDQLLADEDTRLIVAESQGKIIGSGYARIGIPRPHFVYQKYGYLGFMYVDPAFRGKGINGLIVDELKQWLISQGINELHLQVYSSNTAAIKAYEKAGFENLVTEMRMELQE